MSKPPQYFQHASLSCNQQQILFQNTSQHGQSFCCTYAQFLWRFCNYCLSRSFALHLRVSLSNKFELVFTFRLSVYICRLYCSLDWEETALQVFLKEKRILDKLFPVAFSARCLQCGPFKLSNRNNVLKWDLCVKWQNIMWKLLFIISMWLNFYCFSTVFLIYLFDRFVNSNYFMINWVKKDLNIVISTSSSYYRHR